MCLFDFFVEYIYIYTCVCPSWCFVEITQKIILGHKTRGFLLGPPRTWSPVVPPVRLRRAARSWPRNWRKMEATWRCPRLAAFVQSGCWTKNRGAFPQNGWVFFQGKPYFLMDDLGGTPHYFRKHPSGWWFNSNIFWNLSTRKLGEDLPTHFYKNIFQMGWWKTTNCSHLW